MKVAIAGAGIIGLSAALELRGHGVEVTLVDRAPASEASLAAAGMLAPQKEAYAPGPFLELCLRSRTIWPAFAKKLEQLSGQPSTYLESGILISAFDDAEVHWVDATAAWQQACSLRIEVVTGDQARAWEPLLSAKVLSACWIPDDHQVDPRQLLPALIDACRKAGVRFVAQAVTEVVQEAGAAVGLRTAEGIEPADRVVLAAGAWSALIPNSQVPPELLEPVKGQMLELRAPQGPTRILGGPRCYLVPRADGRILVGATEERVGFDKSNTPAAITQLLEGVAELCPALATASVSRVWAGLRPKASEALPVIGPGPLANLVLATGHFRNGVLLAPLTARLISQVILGQRPSVDLKPFRFDRLRS